MGIENPVHILFIAIVALIVLGPKRLPDLARALGSGIREFRDAVGEGSGQQQPQPPAAQTATVVPAAPPAQAATAQAAPVSPPPDVVDPPQAIPSGDAPDRGQL